VPTFRTRVVGDDRENDRHGRTGRLDSLASRIVPTGAVPGEQPRFDTLAQFDGPGRRLDS